MYDVAAGSVVDTIFSTGTYNLTPLEAFYPCFQGNEFPSAYLAA